MKAFETICASLEASSALHEALWEAGLEPMETIFHFEWLGFDATPSYRKRPDRVYRLRTEDIPAPTLEECLIYAEQILPLPHRRVFVRHLERAAVDVCRLRVEHAADALTHVLRDGFAPMEDV